MTMIPLTYQDEGKRRLNFIWLLALVKKWALPFGFMAMGAWAMSIHDQAARIPYQKKATAAFERVERVAGKDPVATVRCLHRKADVAEDVAQTAKHDDFIGAPSADLNKIPDCPALLQEGRSAH